MLNIDHFYITSSVTLENNLEKCNYLLKQVSEEMTSFKEGFKILQETSKLERLANKNKYSSNLEEASLAYQIIETCNQIHSKVMDKYAQFSATTDHDFSVL